MPSKALNAKPKPRTIKLKPLDAVKPQNLEPEPSPGWLYKIRVPFLVPYYNTAPTLILTTTHLNQVGSQQGAAT